MSRYRNMLYMMIYGMIVVGTFIFANPSIQAGSFDCGSANNINVPIQECEALVDLYNNTNGNNWYQNTNRLADTDVCTRHGLLCSNIDGEDRVTDLYLAYNNLEGTLPDTMGALDKVEYVEMSYNLLYGNLPSSWSQWLDVAYIDIQGNNFVGSIPDQWVDNLGINIWGFVDASYNCLATDGYTSATQAWIDMHVRLEPQNDCALSIELVQLSGSDTIYVLVGESFTDPGATWTDAVDGQGTITATSGVVDTNTVGTYILEYSHTNSQNQTETITRTVYVVETLPLCNIRLNINVPIQECEALVDLYNNTNGSNWTNNNNWLTDTNICTWYGITCIANNVSRISLSSNNLQGTLPSSLSVLQSLTRINIQDNQISGELPSSWSTWSNVERFEIDNNQISGELPSSWSGWENIILFTANDNQIGGELPSERETWSDTIVQFWIASNNNLTGYIPTTWIENWPMSNDYISLDQTCITTTGYGEPAQSWVDSSVYMLSQGICSLTLQLSGSDIIYTLVGEPFIDPGAIWLDFFDGEGFITATSGTLDTNTLGNYILEYSHTNSQNQTETITRIVHVVENIPSCSLRPNINVPVDECQALVDFYYSTNGADWVHNNNRNTNTNVCTWVGIQCTNINGQDRVTHILLHPNRNIQGVFPASLSALTEIRSFSISENKISGELPSSWSTRTNIEHFLIHANPVSGPLPSSWSTRENIETFSMVNTQISGPLPSSWSTRTNISSFGIFNNQISGELPSSWSTRENISSFSAWNNQISGELPSSWSTRENIDSFVLFQNQISGPLPSSWSRWENIRLLYLSENQISGELPSSWSTRENIQSIRLQNNQISGELPSSWSTRENIEEFAIGNNQISGELPSSWSTRENIGSFTAWNNQISGQIPDSWSNLPNRPNAYVSLSWNCIMIDGYDQDIQSWIDNNVRMNPQSKCDNADLEIQQNSPNTVTQHSDTITYTISYYNHGPDIAQGVEIYNLGGTGIYIQSASLPYETSPIYDVTYGIPGDICFDQLVSNTTGPYVLALDNAFMFGFEQFIVSSLSYPGGPHRGQWLVTNINYIAPEGSFKDIMKTNMGIDITTIPGCGIPAEEIAIFTIGDVPVGSGGSFTVTMAIDGTQMPSGSSDIVNTAVINAFTRDGYHNNNVFNQSISYQIINPPSTPILEKDDCPDGDFSGSYYDGSCGEKPTDEPSIHPLAAEKEVFCQYDDGDFQNYVFEDVQGTRYADAVQTLLDHCLVHGYDNAGILFGPYNQLKLGELYKIFARLALFDFRQGYVDQHRSYRYYIVGNQVGLWTHIDTSRSAEDIVTEGEFIQALQNYLAYMGIVVSLTDQINAAHSRTMTRGRAAMMIDILLYMMQSRS